MKAFFKRVSPRYKYTYMEEMLGNVAGCRQVFERWMEWEPDEQAWHSYINFELRYKEVDKARTIYERYILYNTTRPAAGSSVFIPVLVVGLRFHLIYLQHFIKECFWFSLTALHSSSFILR